MSTITPARGRDRAPSPPLFDDDDKASARLEIARAFQLAGLTDGNTARCPDCGTAKRGKVKLFADGGWHCHRCGSHGPRNGAIDLLVDRAGWDFTDAVAALLGRPAPIRAGKPRKTITVVEQDLPSLSDFVAEWDRELLHTILTGPWADKAAAGEYYTRWHISPAAVREAGSVKILDAAAMRADLEAQFGLDRLIAAGLVVPNDDPSQPPLWLLSERYPVIECHLDPAGQPLTFQFRPDGRTRDQVAAHKAWKARWSGHTGADGEPLDPHDAWAAAQATDPQAAGDKAPYQAPFLSLRGAGSRLWGCGLWRLARIPNRSVVYAVEGFKDLVAARTIGVEAFALPGVGVMPPEPVLELLRAGGHKVIAALDGDQAGAEGRERLTQVLADAGIPVKAKPLPDGYDICDMLVARHARAGCRCDTCADHQLRHPQDRPTGAR